MLIAHSVKNCAILQELYNGLLFGLIYHGLDIKILFQEIRDFKLITEWLPELIVERWKYENQPKAKIVRSTEYSEEDLDETCTVWYKGEEAFTELLFSSLLSDHHQMVTWFLERLLTI